MFRLTGASRCAFLTSAELSLLALPDFGRPPAARGKAPSSLSAAASPRMRQPAATFSPPSLRGATCTPGCGRYLCVRPPIAQRWESSRSPPTHRSPVHLFTLPAGYTPPVPQNARSLRAARPAQPPTSRRSASGCTLLPRHSRPSPVDHSRSPSHRRVPTWTQRLPVLLPYACSGRTRTSARAASQAPPRPLSCAPPRSAFSAPSRRCVDGV